MYDALAAVMGRLELDPPHFMGHEIRYWPEGELEVLTDWGVLRPISPAAELPCHGCGGDYYGEVVYVTDPRTEKVQVYLPCPECGTSRVDPNELRRWTVDVGQLIRRVFAGSGVRLDVAPLTPDRLWRVGKADWGSHTWTVFFGRMLHRRDAREILGKAKIHSRSVVFAAELLPGADANGDPGPLIISLTSVASWQNGAVCLDQAPIMDRLNEWADAREPVRKRATRKRASRTADIASLTNEMIEHIRSARDYAVATRDDGGMPKLLPRPTQRELAGRLGTSRASVSRCLRDESARELKFLWDLAADLDRILGFRA